MGSHLPTHTHTHLSEDAQFLRLSTDQQGGVKKEKKNEYSVAEGGGACGAEGGAVRKEAGFIGSGLGFI